MRHDASIQVELEIQTLRTELEELKAQADCMALNRIESSSFPVAGPNGISR